ncbi:1,2-phenylacetyl-CoA epoxidase subunit PaaC [Actinomadura sp. HBU206391]|uniref:1,2-phenylacetyl-CoA epoxidase subunit PaaC n=1 Tax=Actinomadura sp. HBU206391 TaxID=2731692 RepID=UPI00164F8B01|nr:1,2-phenylacetyl-CoA epoxidase subunit PaaC [Actinomadura sp. HBU206391]MBC6462242.1 phenylacetate-CoA oxygenase subunit PaaC [Actinomadura sp. HBU206391]
MAFDNALEAITTDNDVRWAFGTGFHDPLAGIDTAVPAGIESADLATYCLMLGDDALVMSHRLQEWCANAPELEEEVALANIALDLLGQARLLLTRSGRAEGAGRSEDDLAFFRDEAQFRNVRLVEAPNGDFAFSIARLLMFATWRLALLDHLASSRDPVLAAIAAKGVKEVAYHREHAALWTVRLGDGTDLSHRRMQEAMEAVWPLTGELFRTHEIERRMADAGVGVDPAAVRAEFDDVLDRVLAAATLRRPDPSDAEPSERSGRHGVHSEAMSGLLTQLQSVARAHPGGTW